MSSKENGVSVPQGVLEESDRSIVIVSRIDNFITFRLTAESKPFYYALVRECLEPEWDLRMREKRWYVDSVNDAVRALL